MESTPTTEEQEQEHSRTTLRTRDNPTENLEKCMYARCRRPPMTYTEKGAVCAHHYDDYMHDCMTEFCKTHPEYTIHQGCLVQKRFVNDCHGCIEEHAKAEGHSCSCMDDPHAGAE